jgi:hypothetical protein
MEAARLAVSAQMLLRRLPFLAMHWLMGVVVVEILWAMALEPAWCHLRHQSRVLAVAVEAEEFNHSAMAMGQSSRQRQWSE